MSTFVLVHAAAFAGWSWFKIVPRLERRGHKVIARDLPGHGRDRTQLTEITFECLVESVCAIVDEQAEPVILVGHSWGGGIITQAAEYRSDRIDAVVYLTGVLPRCGQSMMDCLTLPEGEESLASRALEPSADKSYLSLRLEFVRENNCADCSDEDWALLARLMQPIPTAPFFPPMATTDAKFGRLPKAYIECLQDRALPLPLQRRLQREASIETVLSLDTSVRISLPRTSWLMPSSAERRSPRQRLRHRRAYLCPPAGRLPQRPFGARHARCGRCRSDRAATLTAGGCLRGKQRCWGARERRCAPALCLEGEPSAGVHHRRPPRVNRRDDLLGIDALEVCPGR